jgi:hypothetical protein
MSWRAHIDPDQGAGTRPVLRRTKEAVEQVFLSLAAGTTTADLELLPDELVACFQYASTLIPERMMRRADAGDSKTHVTDRQLEKAFRRHAQTAQMGTNGGATQNDSYLLLLIYAIECGLKRILLARRGHKSTHRLDRDDLTHDLDTLLKLVGYRPCFQNVKLENPVEDAASARVHEALRYGRVLAPLARKHVLAAACDVAAWIEEQL